MINVLLCESYPRAFSIDDEGTQVAAIGAFIVSGSIVLYSVAVLFIVYQFVFRSSRFQLNFLWCKRRCGDTDYDDHKAMRRLYLLNDFPRNVAKSTTLNVRFTRLRKTY